MSKYDKLRGMMREDRAFAKEQIRLHDKHEDIPGDAVIVEKSTAVRSTLAFVKWIAKTAAGVLFIVLAAIGIITLIYPSVRGEFLLVLKGVLNEIKTMI